MKTFHKGIFSNLQKLGKSLMLPVSVLPAAGILLGIGAADLPFIPAAVSTYMETAGGAIFGILPLLFALGVALGFTENDGVAALAATVGYFVMLSTMGIMAAALGFETKAILGIPSIDCGVLGGILSGSMAAALFNKYYRIQLPTYLGFFAGKRFVPIVTALCAIFLGLALSLAWPPIGRMIKVFSVWASSESPALAFGIYGFVNRLLIPFGLHHIWNVPFFFQVGEFTNAAGEVIRGEIPRYLAGDPTAGNLAGGYLFMLWGLPAAGFAIWHAARPEKRALVGSIMISAALTSFLTGITEPLEFAFMFVAPLLYLIHAVLAGLADMTCILLGIRHSMTFSNGLIDYVVLFSKSTRGLWLLVLGPLWAAMYYFLFSAAIRLFRLKTPGREDDRAEENSADSLLQALGGKTNVKEVSVCAHTRLRVTLCDPNKLDEKQCTGLGVRGVVRQADGVCHLIFSGRVEVCAEQMNRLLAG